MAPESRALHGKMAIGAALLASIAFGFGAPALAARGSLREALAIRNEDGRQAATPQVARYMIDEGGNFVLDRHDKRPLLKFDDSPEIWVLQATPGPRGDIIYKNDAGEPMLRATKLGGMTVFTQRRPAGSAAALAGASQPLRLPALGPVVLYNRLFQASVRASRAAQHLIGFEAPDADATSDALIADAAIIAVEALVTVAARPDGRTLLSRVSKIAFVEGGKPAVALQSGVLTITVAPSQGVAGRPSSRRILRATGVR
ncbi:MAG TPA: DUF4908 domain-containing protein [Caulobacteraceae bacterium]|nr:DUF4908 domain-containing protein [Caulobacteraceae bacterium]